MLTAEMLKAIEAALTKGFAVELYRKPDGRLSIKTVSRREVKY